MCDGFTPQNCDDHGIWKSDASCDGICSGGACSGTCTPDATQCNGQIVQTGDATGTWRDGAGCPAKACVSAACVGVCEPGAKQCSSANGVQTCGANGQWGPPADCSTQA